MSDYYDKAIMKEPRKITYVEESELPDDVREHLDTLVEPPDPFSALGDNFFAITEQGQLRYHLADGTQRTVDLDSWRQPLEADWQNYWRMCETAPVLIDRAWQVLDGAGQDLSDRDAVNPFIMPVDNDGGLTVSIEGDRLDTALSAVAVTIWPNAPEVDVVFNHYEKQHYGTADEASQAIKDRWQRDIQQEAVERLEMPDHDARLRESGHDRIEFGAVPASSPTIAGSPARTAPQQRAVPAPRTSVPAVGAHQAGPRRDRGRAVAM